MAVYNPIEDLFQFDKGSMLTFAQKASLGLITGTPVASVSMNVKTFF